MIIVATISHKNNNNQFIKLKLREISKIKKFFQNNYSIEILVKLIKIEICHFYVIILHSKIIFL
jgi:hypothetical protein